MRIIIADDHILFAESFKFLLKKSYKETEISLAHDLKITIETLTKQGQAALPVVLFIDMSGRNMRGKKGLKHILSCFPELYIVLMGNVEDGPTTEELLGSGLKAFLPKNLSRVAFMASLDLILEDIRCTPMDNLDNLERLDVDQIEGGKGQRIMKKQAG